MVVLPADPPQPDARRTRNKPMDVYVDESKARGGYLVVAACVARGQRRASRKELDNLILPGQRSLHMKDERDPRKREITSTIIGIGQLGMRVVVYDAGRTGTERDRRARCLEALVRDALQHDRTRIVFDLDETLLSCDRQRMLELTRAAGARERISYLHLHRHTEPMLAIPDAVAWCWSKGGDWRRRIRPIVSDVRIV
jgi:hypothetical protein